MERRNFAFRLYPTKKQISRLDRNLDLCTLMYNELLHRGLIIFYTSGIIPNAIELKYEVKNIVSTKPMLKSVYAQVLQQIADRVYRALCHYKVRLEEKNLGIRKKAGTPRYKKSVRSFTHPQAGFKIINNKKLTVSKIGNIPIRLHRPIEGNIKTLTIIKKRNNQWYAIFSSILPSSMNMETNNGKEIGIDLGLGNIAILSNGIKIPACPVDPRWKKQVSRKQRRLDKRHYGGKNWGKMRIQLANTHNKIKSIKMDYLHKITNEIVSEYSCIALETIRVQDLSKKSILSKAVGQSSWYTFTKMLEYKAASAGSQVIFCNEYAPTSQLCSNCGVRTKLELFERQFNCPSCGLTIDRDVNAALNILELSKTRAGHVRSHALGDWITTTPLELRIRSLSQELYDDDGIVSSEIPSGLDATFSEFRY